MPELVEDAQRLAPVPAGDVEVIDGVPVAGPPREREGVPAAGEGFGVLAHYAPSAGHFPHPGWAGLALLCAYTVVVALMAVGRKPAAVTDWR